MGGQEPIPKTDIHVQAFETALIDLRRQWHTVGGGVWQYLAMANLSDPRRIAPSLVGRAVECVEDTALVTGRGRFSDDPGERPGTAHAAVLRSPLAHAAIVSVDAAAALSMPGVVTVLTGEDVAAWSRPFIAGVKQPMRHYASARNTAEE